MNKDIICLSRKEDQFFLLDLKEAIAEIHETAHTNPEYDRDELLHSLTIGERVVTSRAVYKRIFPSDIKDGLGERIGEVWRGEMAEDIRTQIEAEGHHEFSMLYNDGETCLECGAARSDARRRECKKEKEVER